MTTATAPPRPPGSPPGPLPGNAAGTSDVLSALDALVAADLAEQVAKGSRILGGVMIESHLVEGRQEWQGREGSTYGCSITDACISFEQTSPVLDQLAAAVRARRALPKA